MFFDDAMSNWKAAMMMVLVWKITVFVFWKKCPLKSVIYSLTYFDGKLKKIFYFLYIKYFYFDILFILQTKH